jgi:hypothetical protein
MFGHLLSNVARACRMQNPRGFRWCEAVKLFAERIRNEFGSSALERIRALFDELHALADLSVLLGEEADQLWPFDLRTG